MSDVVETAAAPATETTESGPTEAEIKASFAKSVEADSAEPADDTPDAPAKGKPKDAAKDPKKPGKDPAKDPEADDDKPPTPGERAAFRAEKRTLRQQRDAFEAEKQRQDQMFDTERRVWTQAHQAYRNGDAIGLLRALNLDPAVIAEQLAGHAAGEDPRIEAMHRKLAEYERQRYHEHEAAQSAQAEAQLRQQQAALETQIGDALGGSTDVTLQAIAEDPELVAMVRADLTEAWRDDGGDEAAARKYLTPQAYLAAARRVARQLKAEHTRRGKLFRESVEADQGTVPKPSAAAKLDSRGGKQSKPTRTLPASQGGSRVRAAEPDPNTTAGMAEIKRRFASMVQAADD